MITKLSALTVTALLSSQVNAQTTIFQHCPDTSNIFVSYRWDETSGKRWQQGVYLEGIGYLSWHLRDAQITGAVGTVASKSAGLVYHEGWDACGGYESVVVEREGCEAGQTDVGANLTQSVGTVETGVCVSSGAMAFPILPECMPTNLCYGSLPRTTSTTVCSNFADCLVSSSLRMGTSSLSHEVWSRPAGQTGPFTYYDTAYVIGQDIDAFHANAAYLWEATVAGSPKSPPYFEVQWRMHGLALLYGCGAEGVQNDFMGAYYDVKHVGVEVLFQYTHLGVTTNHRGVVGVVQESDGTLSLKRLGLAAGVTPTWNGNEYEVAGTFNVPSDTGIVQVQGIQRTFELPGDLNSDGHVNHYDRLAIAALFGATLTSSNYTAQADVNLDGVINASDLYALQRNPKAFSCAGDFDGNHDDDNNDSIMFISRYFAGNALADIGKAGGFVGSDGVFDNNDFIAFNTLFFDWEVGCQ